MSNKHMMVTEAANALKELGVSYTLWEGTDVMIHSEFLDAAWGSGSKKIQYDASVLFDEAKQEIFMWEMTKESGSGISFGSSNESSFQTGKTLFRKVKSVQYGTDGKAYEINLDLGAITKVFKEIAKKYDWKFHTVLKKDKASYSENQINETYDTFVPQKTSVRTPEEEAESTDRSSYKTQSRKESLNPDRYQTANAKEHTMKKSNGILFWILFGVLAAFDILMIIGGSGTAFTIGALVVLGLLIVMRKFIGTGLIKTLIIFFLASLVTLVIFGLVAVPVDSETTGESDGSTTEEAASQSGAVSEGFSRTVDSTTLAPLLKTTTFTQLDEVIYFSVLCYEIPANAELMVKWYLNGELAIEVGPEVFPEGLKDQYYTTMLEKGDNPFPVGEYQVEFVISKDGAPIFTAVDTCEVVAEDADSEVNTTGMILFEDTFDRADADVVGTAWEEVMMRGGTGNSVPLKDEGDSPWRIKNGVLSYEGTGDGTYTEDYIQTVGTFPVENVMVEFELKGTAATSLGYVGPGAFWAPDADLRLGGYASSDTTQELIGVQAFYSWETGGTSGFVYRLGGSIASTGDTFGGVNEGAFVKHTLMIKDGMLNYQVGDGQMQAYPLTNLPEAGATRHFSFDVRYYDNGVPFTVEIKNFKITELP